MSQVHRRRRRAGRLYDNDRAVTVLLASDCGIQGGSSCTAIDTRNMALHNIQSILTALKCNRKVR